MTIPIHDRVASCKEFRQLAGADPQHAHKAAHEHCAHCPACADYLKQMLDLDSLLKRALQLPITHTAAVPIKPARQPSATGRWFALAASALLSLAIATGIWLSTTPDTLAAELVEHIYSEPGAMIRTSDRAPSEEVEDVLRKGGVRLAGAHHEVSFAKICPFRGGDAPHLIVQTAQGPVTVMVLTNSYVEAAETFDEQGYRGTIMPSGKGTIAIIASSAAAIEEAAAKIASSIEWIA